MSAGKITIKTEAEDLSYELDETADAGNTGICDHKQDLFNLETAQLKRERSSVEEDKPFILEQDVNYKNIVISAGAIASRGETKCEGVPKTEHCTSSEGCNSIILETVTCTNCNKPLFQCKCCRKSFVRIVKLNIHDTKWDSTHELNRRNKKCKCIHCNKWYSSKDSLIAHMDYIHNNCRRINHEVQCPKCLLTLCNNYSLNMHMRVHDGQRPYHCTECSKLFSQQGTLIAHIRMHKIANSPLQCVKHGKLFRRSCDECKQVRLQAGGKLYACKLCTEVFACRSSLNYHVKKHSGSRPYNCHICNISYLQKCALVVHTRRHTGERPYTCGICSASFYESSHAVDHRKRH